MKPKTPIIKDKKKRLISIILMALKSDKVKWKDKKQKERGKKARKKKKKKEKVCRQN